MCDADVTIMIDHRSDFILNRCVPIAVSLGIDRELFVCLRFRKSAHFAWAKRAIRVQEADKKTPTVSDIWKRFPEGEEFDLRANYGLTSKRTFPDSLKVHDMNPENAPVITTSADVCEIPLPSQGTVVEESPQKIAAAASDSSSSSSSSSSDGE